MKIYDLIKNMKALNPNRICVRQVVRLSATAPPTTNRAHG